MKTSKTAIAILILLHMQRVRINTIRATAPTTHPIIFYFVKLDF